ncbi:MAG: tRNA (guanosine(46)-N7)-methyltransferase TrmB [Lentisphaerae bacterium]|nr:tRNA (guanosine(46)-N7)-methyltransferase TrmB [Lentisphaerota bacterium]
MPSESNLQTPVSGSLRLLPKDWAAPLPVEALRGPDALPLEVDVGCGKGRFLLARARAHPDTRFLGIDACLTRLEKIDRRIVRQGLGNIRLLYVEAYYAVTYLLPSAAVDAMYVLFPDPWPKRRHGSRRLFSAPFMDALARALIPGGVVHVATDHPEYIERIRVLFAGDRRFEPAPVFQPTEEERTDYELQFTAKGRSIGRSSWKKT